MQKVLLIGEVAYLSKEIEEAAYLISQENYRANGTMYGWDFGTMKKNPLMNIVMSDCVSTTCMSVSILRNINIKCNPLTVPSSIHMSNRYSTVSSSNQY